MITIGKANTPIDPKSLYITIQRMVNHAPEWPNGTVIYQIEDRFYAGRRGACDQIIANNNAVIILECGDLDEIFKDFGNCEDDAAWLLAHIIQENLGRTQDDKYADLLRRMQVAIGEVEFSKMIPASDYSDPFFNDGITTSVSIIRRHVPELWELGEVSNELL